MDVELLIRKFLSCAAEARKRKSSAQEEEEKEIPHARGGKFIFQLQWKITMESAAGPKVIIIITDCCHCCYFASSSDQHHLVTSTHDKHITNPLSFRRDNKARRRHYNRPPKH
jgi:hypothetical protein